MLNIFIILFLMKFSIYYNKSIKKIKEKRLYIIYTMLCFLLFIRFCLKNKKVKLNKKNNDKKY